MSFLDAATEGVIDELNGGDFPNAGHFAHQQAIDIDQEFDTSDTTEKDLESGGMVDLEGGYHFEVDKVEFNLGLLSDDGKEQSPHLLVTCTVLESVKGQSPAGSKLFHRIYVAQKDGSPAKKGSIESMERFASGVGVMRWADVGGQRRLVSSLTGKTALKLREFTGAVGKQFCGFVKKEASNDPKYKDKPRYVLPMGRAYHPAHPDVSHVPKNADALRAGGYLSNDPPTQPTAVKPDPKPTTSPAAAAAVATPEPAAAAGGNWDLDSL